MLLLRLSEDDGILFRLHIVAVAFRFGAELKKVWVAFWCEAVDLIGSAIAQTTAFHEAGQIAGLDVPDAIEDHMRIIVVFVLRAPEAQQLGVLWFVGVHTHINMGFIVRTYGAGELQHFDVLAELKAVVAHCVVSLLPIAGIGLIQQPQIAVQVFFGRFLSQVQWAPPKWGLPAN